MPRVLKLVAMAFAALVLAFTALGLMLPRDMRIVRSLELAAPRSVVAAEIDDLRRWQAWAFGDEAQGCSFQDGTAAALRWTCGEVTGALLRTDLSEQALWVDARVAGQIEDVRMKISLAEVPAGTRITWEEHARGPRVVGAWLRPWLERARGAEIDAALQRLSGRIQASPQKAS